MLNIALAHTKNIQLFYAIIVQQSSHIAVTFSFIHTSLTGGHNPEAENLVVSRCSHPLSQ